MLYGWSIERASPTASRQAARAAAAWASRQGGWRAPRLALPVGRGADAQQDGPARQLGGKFQVAQSLGRHPQADGRAADGEMSLAAQRGLRVGEAQGAGGRPVAVGGAPLHVL